MTEFFIPKPPVDIYEGKGDRAETILEEANETWLIEKIDYSNGINIYVQGAQFPKKGFPTPESIWSANQAKRVFIEGVRVFNSWQFIFSFVFTWNKIKFIEKILASYNNIALKAIQPFILKREFLTPIARELNDISINFLISLGLNEIVAIDFSKILSFMIDIDTAYRYRVQDVFSETDSDTLCDNPRKEISRLVGILKDRDAQNVFEKFYFVAKIVRLLLFIPRVKKAFIEAIRLSNFENLQYNEADYYWALMRKDYKIIGKSFEERMEIIKQNGWSIPTPVKIK